MNTVIVYFVVPHAILLLANLADYWTTERALRHGKREMNPIMRGAMRVFGRFWLGAKGVLSHGSLLLLALLGWPELAAVLALAAAALYGVVAVRNYREL